MSAPVAVPELTGAVDLVTGSGQSCALLPDATVRCWGLGPLGQLGNGALLVNPLPVQVVGL